MSPVGWGPAEIALEGRPLVFETRLTTVAGWVLCAGLFAGVAAAQTYPGNATNTAGNSLIPSTGSGSCGVVPQTTGGTVFDNPVAGLAAGALVLNTQINLNHTWDSDLAIFLRAPNGQVLELTSGNGGSGDNYTNSVFQDGFPSITTGTPPFTGTFSPEGTTAATCGLAGNIATLGAFTAGQNGNWQLVIMDSASGDTGTMLGWSITFAAPACTLTCPANPTVGTDSNQCGAVVNYPAPTPSGDCGPVICTPPSGSFYPLGSTPVTCFEDFPDVGEGTPGGASCSFSVTVFDTQPPSVTAPANQNVGTDAGVCSAVVNYPAPTISDNCPGVTASCAPPSGSTFPLGSTPAICTALDAAGNTATAGFSVTVFDDEPPALTCPADVFATAPPGSLSWPVSFATPTPTDNCPGATAGCVPPSGSAFPVGTTTAVCTAVDGAGLQAACDFDVTVEERVIQEIPTASTLGLALLALLLAGAAVVALRRG